MVRTPYIDGNGLKKGAWSPEEDQKLRSYIKKYGHWNWRELPKYAGLTRCGKSCRLRWINYLKPNIKHGNYTEQEEDLIIKLHQQLGNRWSTIAGKLSGRTDNDIKNYWHTHLKKRMVQHQLRTKKGRNHKFTGKSQPREPQTMETSIILDCNKPKTNLPVQILESCPIYPSSPQLSSSNEISTLNSETISSTINDYINDYTPALNNSGWCSGLGSGLGSSSSLSINSGFNQTATSSWDTLGELAEGRFWTEPFSLENNQHHENEFNFLDPIISSPYMLYVEDMEFSSLLSESLLLDGNNLI